MRDELFRAARGQGAYNNKKKLRVSKTKKLKNALLATGFAYDFKKARRSNVENFIHFMVAGRAIRRAGSAALDLCYVACGRFDGFWELDLYPWDTAAGYLMVEEAGGVVSRFDNSGYSHYDKDILASNGTIHSAMVTVLSNAAKNTIDLIAYARSSS
jgi:myo-inositol-1(or 4)-monophosphatase